MSDSVILRHRPGSVVYRGQWVLLDGKPVKDVPPDWLAPIYPHWDDASPVDIDWWARHPDGTYTQVFKGGTR